MDRRTKCGQNCNGSSTAHPYAFVFQSINLNDFAVNRNEREQCHPPIKLVPSSIFAFVVSLNLKFVCIRNALTKIRIRTDVRFGRETLMNANIEYI